MLGVEMLVEFGIAVGYVGTLARGVGVDFTADDARAARHFFCSVWGWWFCLGLVILIWLAVLIWLAMLIWLVMLIWLLLNLEKAEILLHSSSSSSSSYTSRASSVNGP